MLGDCYARKALTRRLEVRIRLVERGSKLGKEGCYAAKLCEEGRGG